MTKGRDGMTLVEVLLAAALLGMGLVALLGGLSNCLAVMRASNEYQRAQWALSLGELAHPLTEVKELEEIDVPPDSSLAEGFTFERTVEKREILDSDEDDGLYVVHTRIYWGSGGEGESEELVSYIWLKDVAK